jgi:hypothetical protein
MPNRPASHIIGERAVLALRNSLPREWVIRNVSEDYGIDCEIEIVDEQLSVTGAIIKVQVKGTLKSIKSIYVRLATVKYWLAIPVPVILIQFVESEGKILWLNVREYLLHTEQLESIFKTRRKNITFKFDGNNLLKNTANELKYLALSHQFGINQWRRNQESQMMIDWAGFNILIKVFDGNPNKWLKWLREKGSDDQIASDYSFVLWLKNESEKDETFLPRVNQMILENTK